MIAQNSKSPAHGLVEKSPRSDSSSPVEMLLGAGSTRPRGSAWRLAAPILSRNSEKPWGLHHRPHSDVRHRGDRHPADAGFQRVIQLAILQCSPRARRKSPARTYCPIFGEKDARVYFSTSRRSAARRVNYTRTAHQDTRIEGSEGGASRTGSAATAAVRRRARDLYVNLNARRSWQDPIRYRAEREIERVIQTLCGGARTTLFSWPRRRGQDWRSEASRAASSRPGARDPHACQVYMLIWARCSRGPSTRRFRQR